MKLVKVVSIKLKAFNLKIKQVAQPHTYYHSSAHFSLQ